MLHTKVLSSASTCPPKSLRKTAKEWNIEQHNESVRRRDTETTDKIAKERNNEKKN